MSTSASYQSSSQSASLDTLAEDIQYLIASELIKSSPNAVLALSQSSRTLRQATLFFVYRNVVLTQGTRKGWSGKAYRALLEIWRQDETCDVAKHVRSVTVSEELPEEDLVLFFNQIAKRGTLRKLSWNTAAHMPDSVYDILHATWPNLELSVRVLNRQTSIMAAHRQMDMKLLSSPLLRELAYNVFYQGYNAGEPARCEWPKITQAIIAGGNLRVLRIQSERDGSHDYRIKILDESEPAKLMRLDITPGKRLPALEELTISEQWGWGSSTYLWDTYHCRMLREAMDWSLLRKIDFGGDRPDEFFVVFTGILSELKSLRFGVRDGSMGAVIGFMDSVTAFEALDIAEAGNHIDTLWPAIYKHKETLKVLVLRPATDDGRRVYTSRRLIWTISKEFPSLERLGWDVPCATNVAPKWLESLSTMNLLKLDLFLHLPNEACDYSALLMQDAMGTIPAPPLDKDRSKKAAIGIIETISKAQTQPPEWLELHTVSNAQRRPLEWLMLHFTRTGYSDRFQPYQMCADMQVRRSKNQDAEGDEAYEVRGRQSWSERAATLRDELLFEEE